MDLLEGSNTKMKNRLHNEFHSLHPSLDITKSRTIKLAGYVERMGEMRSRKAGSKKGPTRRLEAQH